MGYSYSIKKKITSKIRRDQNAYFNKNTSNRPNNKWEKAEDVWLVEIEEDIETSKPKSNLIANSRKSVKKGKARTVITKKNTM